VGVGLEKWRALREEEAMEMAAETIAEVGKPFGWAKSYRPTIVICFDFG
jgi:hypothetical protein